MSLKEATPILPLSFLVQTLLSNHFELISHCLVFISFPCVELHILIDLNSFIQPEGGEKKQKDSLIKVTDKLQILEQLIKALQKEI